jgi:hypothetical protein
MGRGRLTIVTEENHAGLPLLAYDGWDFVGGNFPLAWEPWDTSVFEPSGPSQPSSARFVPPEREVFVFCDAQGDPGATLRSFVLSGAVAKIGPDDEDIELSPRGERGVFVFLGDMLGRGQSSLRVLRILRRLKDLGADVRVLAGNEELRMYLALWAIGRQEGQYAHLTVRGGKQLVGWIQEVLGDPNIDTSATLGEQEAKEMLLVGDEWFERFPEWSEGIVPPQHRVRELSRIKEKCVEFVMALEEAKLTFAEAATAAIGLREACFVGEFECFFNSMRLMEQIGSTLFVHAGVNDVVTEQIRADQGVDGLNDEFRRMLKVSPMAMYHGNLGNCVRTRYRISDEPLGDGGIRALEQAGVSLLVHGHSVSGGDDGDGCQRLSRRGGVMDVDCDVTINVHRRAKLGLEQAGAAVVILQPSGLLCGLSSDMESGRWVDCRASGPGEGVG